MKFDEKELESLKRVAKRIEHADPESKQEWEMRAAISVAIMRQNFPGLEDEVLAAISSVVAFVAGELGEMSVTEAGDAIAAVYMSYALAAAQLLKLYTPDSEHEIKVEKVADKKPADFMRGGYL